MKNFWRDLPPSFLAQAPMEGVTDIVFRNILQQVGPPDVFFTEFTSTDGLCSIGFERVAHRLKFNPEQRPMVAQIWGTVPEKYLRSAQMLVEMGFDGIDINMGCPVRDVVAHGSCSALIKNPSLAQEIIQATKEGAGELPVSVKTRIGFGQIQTEEWCEILLKQDIAALTVHLRTAKEMSKVPAHWEESAKVVALRDSLQKPTRIIGNGDIQSREQAELMVKQYGVDGVMIGRGIFHNLWVFNAKRSQEVISVQERLETLQKHLTLYDTTWQGTKPFAPMKKFVKVYVSGFDGASELRETLMTLPTSDAMLAFLEEQLLRLKSQDQA